MYNNTHPLEAGKTRYFQENMEAREKLSCQEPLTERDFKSRDMGIGSAKKMVLIS